MRSTAACAILHLLRLPVWLASGVRIKKVEMWEASPDCSISASSHSLQPHYPHAGAQAIASGYEAARKEESLGGRQDAEAELAASRRGQPCFADGLNHPLAGNWGHRAGPTPGTKGMWGWRVFGGGL